MSSKPKPTRSEIRIYKQGRHVTAFRRYMHRTGSDTRAAKAAFGWKPEEYLIDSVKPSVS